MGGKGRVQRQQNCAIGAVASVAFAGRLSAEAIITAQTIYWPAPKGSRSSAQMYTTNTLLPVVSDQVLLEKLESILPKSPFDQAIVISAGRTQVACRLLEMGVGGVTAWYLDQYRASQAAWALQEQPASETLAQSEDGSVAGQQDAAISQASSLAPSGVGFDSNSAAVAGDKLAQADTELERKPADGLLPQLDIVCSTDLPPLVASDAEEVSEPHQNTGKPQLLKDGQAVDDGSFSRYDLAILSTSKSDEVELTRELLQQCILCLNKGGRLVASVDNPRDSWLHDQLRLLFDKVTRTTTSAGCVYVARKTRVLKKVKDFRCWFQFKDEFGNLLKAVSRPGVFSHRRLDPGARQLMRAFDIGPDDRVLDYGCGAGVLAATAATQTQKSVMAVDSNARAVQCTIATAAANGLEHVAAVVNSDGELGLDGEIDVALANPPYFGGNSISKHFVDASRIALRSGGALLVVTKKPSLYREYFDGLMEDVEIFPSGKYYVACARRP